jgi:alkaline phosphatase D
MMKHSRFKRHLVDVLLLAAILSIQAISQVGVRSGPMVGYGEMTEVMLWVQCTDAADVQYRYWVSGEPDRKLTLKARAEARYDYVVHILVTGLEPGKEFEYELLLNDKVFPLQRQLRFQTQTLWQFRTDPPAFTVAIGSCAYINDPPFDRPGTPYGSGYEIFTAIAAKEPDLMIWLGDNTYYREADWTSESRMRYRFAHTRALPEMQALLGATHHYAIWDDHDYGPNDSDRSFKLKEAALRTFQLFWAPQTLGVDGVPGVFSRFVWGDVEFFLLDNRYHRSPNRMPESPEKVMFDKKQMQWLKESLVSSRAPFKIVAGGNQMLNPMSMHEAFAKFPDEQRDLLDWLKKADVWGVLFLSGDRHHTELIRLDDTAFYPLYDFTSSPLTAGMGRPEQEKDNPHRIPGTWVTDKHNFGLLRFDGPRTDRRLTMECYDKNGNLLWSHVVTARELRPRRDG